VFLLIAYRSLARPIMFTPIDGLGTKLTEVLDRTGLAQSCNQIEPDLGCPSAEARLPHNIWTPLQYAPAKDVSAGTICPKHHSSIDSLRLCSIVRQPLPHVRFSAWHSQRSYLITTFRVHSLTSPQHVSKRSRSAQTLDLSTVQLS